MTPQFSYVRASSLKEAIKHAAGKEARIHAGGTDLLGCLRDHIFSAETMMSISKLAKLKGIEQTADGGLRIGALTTIKEIASSPVIAKSYAGLAQAASEVASPQLRNQGTIGGNLCQKPRCWYYRGEFHCIRKGGGTCYAKEGENQYHAIFGADGTCWIVHPSDTAPALMSLGAVVGVQGEGGSRKIPMEKFFVRPGEDPEKETVLEPGEIVTQIFVPKPAAGLRSSYRKVRARRSWDFALAGVALAAAFKGKKVTSARVVLSGAAPVPWRLPEVEKVIVGTELDGATIVKASLLAVKGAEPLEKNAYKIPMFKGVIQEQLESLREA
jgi:xanthine dehydrogenase YagS FAD-binding subunit